MNRETAWTAEMVETMREGWSAGKSAARIAKDMGLRKNQIIGAAHRYGMPPRPSPIVRPPGYQPKPRNRPVRRAHAEAAAKLPRLACLADDETPPQPVRRPHQPATPRRHPNPKPTPAPAQAPRVRAARCCFPTWDHRKPKTEEYRAALRAAQYLECGDPVCVGFSGNASPYCARHYAVMFSQIFRPLDQLKPQRHLPSYVASPQEQQP